MNNDGYIHSHRSDRDHWTWQNPRYYQWWSDIRFEVNYKPGGANIKGKYIECGRGQSIRSVTSWASRWNTNRNTVKRFFKLLVDHKEISIEVIPNRTIRLTVLNYNYYSPSCTTPKPTVSSVSEDRVPPSSKKNDHNRKNEDSCLTEENSLEKNYSDEQAADLQSPGGAAQEKNDIDKMFEDFLETEEAKKLAPGLPSPERPNHWDQDQ